MDAEPETAIAVSDRLARLAGAVGLAGAGAAVAFGLVGRNMAIPFAVSTAILAGSAIASGRVRACALLRAMPLTGLGVVALAAVASEPIAATAGTLPRPDAGLLGLGFALAVGGLLAAVANNLPATAFGAVWLMHSHPATIVAYLLGTNIVAIATPHGSVATILARGVGARHGVASSNGSYLRGGWRYAAAGAMAGFVALAVVAR